MSDNKPTQPVVTEEKRAELERQGREYLNLPMAERIQLDRANAKAKIKAATNSLGV